jgi:hypothetical protein
MSNGRDEPGVEADVATGQGMRRAGKPQRLQTTQSDNQPHPLPRVRR